MIMAGQRYGSEKSLKKILFVAGTETHVKTFTEIVKCLPNEYACMFIPLYCREKSESILRNLSLPFKWIEDYGTKKIDEIIKIENPDLIVFSYDTDAIPRLFVKAAKRLNIPTLLIEEGPPFRFGTKKFSIISYLKSFFNTVLFLEEYNLIERLGLLWEIILKKIKKQAYDWGHAGCTKIAVSGEYTKKNLIAEGIDSNDIIITGQPRFDGLCSEEKNIENLIDHNQSNILWTTENYVEGGYCSKEEWSECIEKVINSLKGLDYYQLLIKLHPYEDSQKYEHFKNNPHIHIYKNSLNELLRTCDVLITFVSTTALEATICDKPVIILGFFDFSNKQFVSASPYVKSGAAIGVYKEEDLVPTIKDVLYNEEVRKKLAEVRKKFIYELAYIQDGKASGRVVNLITQMIEESKRRGK